MEPSSLMTPPYFSSSGLMERNFPLKIYSKFTMKRSSLYNPRLYYGYQIFIKELPNDRIPNSPDNFGPSLHTSLSLKFWIPSLLPTNFPIIYYISFTCRFHYLIQFCRIVFGTKVFTSEANMFKIDKDKSL